MAEGEKKTERKNLAITQVEEIKKVGDKQIPKLSFKAKDGDKEFVYFTFRSSLFELIKQGQTINADVETSTRDWEGTIYTDRRMVQIYVDGQPVGNKGQQGYRGKSPEELEQQARVMVLSYAKDLAVADKIKVVEIINQADVFYGWLKRNELPKVLETKPESKTLASPQAKTAAPLPTKPSETNISDEMNEQWEKIGKESSFPSGKAIPNVTDFKRLLMNHKIPTHEAYEILSIKSFSELIDLDEAWNEIKKIKNI